MTQQRRAEKEDQLLEAATHLFKEKGYHSTSMQELADALGMQKGSLYYYNRQQGRIAPPLDGACNLVYGYPDRRDLCQ